MSETAAEKRVYVEDIEFITKWQAAEDVQDAMQKLGYSSVATMNARANKLRKALEPQGKTLKRFPSRKPTLKDEAYFAELAKMDVLDTIGDANTDE